MRREECCELRREVFGSGTRACLEGAACLLSAYCRLREFLSLLREE